MSRSIQGPGGQCTVEPLVMQVLTELARRAGQVVTRQEIFERCWGKAAVGDDSLNRVITALRRALGEASQGQVAIETVPRTGYVLRFLTAGDQVTDRPGVLSASRAIQDGLDSIRLGLPEPDHLRLELLRRAAEAEPENARLWGMLAMLCRHAAEYAEPPAVAGHLSDCEAAARRALAIDPEQLEALTAVATVQPLFGRWMDAHTRLSALAGNRSSARFPAVHELAIVEMATGRISCAKGLVDRLIAEDPLAACLSYKSTYQHWSIGDLAGMDHAADRAIQLWPAHPAVWTARFWTLAFTGRAPAALAMLEDKAVRPPVPPPALRLLQLASTAAAGDKRAANAAAEAGLQAARMGPAGAIAAMFTLGLIGRIDEQEAVAFAYYLQEGEAPVPMRRSPSEPSINDQHRRVTQILFTPACEVFRSRAGFKTLCARIGLAGYWEASGQQPEV